MHNFTSHNIETIRSISLLKTPSRKRTRGPGDELQANDAKRRSSLPYGLLIRSELTPTTKVSTICKDIARIPSIFP